MERPWAEGGRPKTKLHPGEKPLKMPKAKKVAVGQRQSSAGQKDDMKKLLAQLGKVAGPLTRLLESVETHEDWSFPKSLIWTAFVSRAKKMANKAQ